MAAAPWQETLEKILALHALQSGCVVRLRHLACRTDVSPEDFRKSVARFEEILKVGGIPDEAALAAEPSLHEDCRVVIGLAGDSPRLLERLRAAPSLVALPRETLATLLHLADLRADPADGMTTSDAPFLRILRYLNNSGTIDDVRELLRALLLDDLAHLIALAHQHPHAMEQLGRVATGDTWTAEMQAIEAELDRRAEGLSGAAPGGIGDDAIALLEEALKPTEPPSLPALAALLLQHPRFSAMTREEVIGFGRVGARYRPEQRSTLFQSDLGEFSERNRYRGAADQLLNDPDWQEERKKAEDSLALRIAIANHFRDLRRIAKLDALERNWPALYSSLEADLKPIIDVEDLALRAPLPNQPSTPDERWARYLSDERWARYLCDDRLLQLLRLRPYISDIHPGEYEKYKEISQQLPTIGPKPPAASGALPPGALAPAAPPSYATIEVKIALAPPEAPQSPEPAGPQGAPTEPPTSETPEGPAPQTPEESPLKFRVELLDPDGKLSKGDVSLKWSDVQGEIQALERAQRGQLAVAPTRDLSRALDLNEILKRIGIKLHDWFFQKTAPARLDELLKLDKAYRIFLNLDGAPQLGNLPWEALYLPSREVAVALSHRASLVRYEGAAAATTPPPFTTPLRTLVVIPAPEGLPPLEGGQEKQILQQTLSRGPVHLKFLEDEKASLEETQAALRDFRPNIFQFIGHGHYDAAQRKGRLIFQEGTRWQLVEPDKLANLLRDSMVGLAILNGCDTGRSSSNDSLSSVAAATVQAGVPAAVATMREVYDEAALLFSRVFYRSFVSGDSLEISLIEARKALYNGNWNWSAYALFSGVKPDLGFLRLTAPSNRTTPNP